MGMVSGKGSKMTLTLVSGISPKLMGSECTPGQMVISTKALGTTASSMAMAQTRLPMEILTLASIMRDSTMVEVLTLGLLVKYMWEISEME